MSLNYILLPLYIIIFITAVCGNSLFIAAIVKNKKLHSAVFIFLANESLSDLIFIILSVFKVVEFLMNNWIFSDAFCWIKGEFIEVCYTVSILSLSAVAIERYILICHLHKTRKTVTWCLRASGLIWILSMLICSPLFYGYAARMTAETTNITIHIGTEQEVNFTTTEITYYIGVLLIRWLINKRC